ncbi:MAG: DNA integrity scanning protein DisA nucleotide-binding domain protein [Deltaproteobacteria bacterium]|nr:DNA integrity scanning protein DisA nucleotide-binding domain protein [Deltaproteobacteria bacterium]
MTAIDGATVLDRNLALQAFGVILPVAHDIRVSFAVNPEASSLTEGDLACRGTRHRASATFAAEHPGAVVFVASEDGDVSCMFRPAGHECAIVFRLGRRDAV